MISLDSYKLLFSNKKIKIIYLWMFITIFIICSVIIIMKNVSYVDFYQNRGLGTKEGYIKTIIKVTDTEKLVNNNKLVIDNKNYNYKIVKFSDSINPLGDNFYQEVLIKIDEKVSINRYISFKIPIDEYNLFDYIKNKIRGNI